MDRRIVYTRPDGGVSIVVPAHGVLLKRVMEKAVPKDVANVYECDVADLPNDRTFRDAWACDGKSIGHDMAKCRAIHMDRIRAARDAELRRLDVEQLKGLDVQAEKQKLRDLPQTIDLTGAETPEALKAIWPKELA